MLSKVYVKHPKRKMDQGMSDQVGQWFVHSPLVPVCG